jgi:hypothetical protein
MKLILIVMLTCTLYANAQAQSDPKTESRQQQGKRPVDSSFVRLVRGLNQLLKNRVSSDFPKFSSASYADYVIIDEFEKVSIDSLAKYRLKDFKSITVSFDEPVAVYGGKAEQGVIILKRRKSN